MLLSQLKHIRPGFCAASALLALAVVCAGCGRTKPIVVGSGTDTEQILVGEIVVQHLEHRLPKRNVQRRLGLGGELILYQALTGGDVTLFPDYTGSIVSAILRERPSPEPDVVLERARNEMRRLAQAELLDPLGYDNPPVVVVRTADAKQDHARTLSEAAAGSFRWSLGVSYEFQQRSDGLPALSTYKLPVEGIRGMEASRLLPSLREGQVTMIVANATDSRLVAPDLTILDDDRKAFPSFQACLLVRQDALAAEPQLRAALSQLSGKLTTQAIRTMSLEVDQDHRAATDVAAEFLAKAGLK